MNNAKNGLLMVCSLALMTSLGGCAVMDDVGNLLTDVNQLLNPDGSDANYADDGGDPDYAPAPTDNYVAQVNQQDIVIINNDTYIMGPPGPNGVRQRVFYGHGDMRRQAWERHNHLHEVMNRHGGHLPPPTQHARLPQQHHQQPDAHGAVAHGTPANAPQTHQALLPNQQPNHGAVAHAALPAQANAPQNHAQQANAQKNQKDQKKKQN
jgi:hypothetical protein